MDVFTAAPHHDVLALTVQIALLLIAARAFGFLAQRFGQPAVVGEILSGVVLGPSLVSTLFPVLGVWILPQNEVQGYLLEVVALLGAMFLLLMSAEPQLATDRLMVMAAGALGNVGLSQDDVSLSTRGLMILSTGMLAGYLLPLRFMYLIVGRQDNAYLQSV